MTTSNFYISDENYNNLKEVANKSALVNSLLSEHFNSKKDLKEVYDEKTKEINKLVSEADKINVVITEKEINENAEAEYRRKQTKEYEDSDEHWAKIELMLRPSFDKLDISKEIKEEKFIEFMFMLKDNRVRNVIDYANQKGYTFKEDTRREL